MKLLIGLGNPGKKYEHTRHNVGFLAVNALANKLGLEFELKKKLNAEIAKNSRVILARPQTFMNDSGKVVQRLIKNYRLSIIDLLIVHDEIDLPLGKIRMSNGGTAGHKGVESIIMAIGPGFTRLRIGIENRTEYRVPETDAYVLQKFTTEEEQEITEKTIPEAVKLITNWLGK